MSTIDETCGVASEPNISPPSPKPPSSGARDGYTLIEVLIVLAIASVMAAMMIGGVRQLQGLLRLGERSASQMVAEAVADRIADDLAGALELPLLGAASVEPVSLAGSRDELRFAAVVRIGFLTQALREVAFSIESPAGRRTLVRKLLPRRLDQDGQNRDGQMLVLHPDITAITFQYMMMDASGNAVWMDEWIGRPRLPVAVRFQIEISAKGERLSASRTVRMPG